MAAVRKVDSDLQAWVHREWMKKGAILQEFDVRHSRYPGSAGVPVTSLNKDDLKRLDDSHKIALELDDAMLEHSRGWPGLVRYEVCAIGENNRILSVHIVKKKGEAQDEDELGEISVDPKSIISMLLNQNLQLSKQNKEITHEAVSALTAALADARRDGQEIRRLNDHYAETQLKAIQMIEAFADGRLERDIKLKRALRFDQLQEKGLQTAFKLLPGIIEKFTRGTALEAEGKMLSIAPKMKAILAGLNKDPERAAKVLALLTEEERTALLALSELHDEMQAQDENANSEIKVTPIERPSSLDGNGAAKPDGAAQ